LGGIGINRSLRGSASSPRYDSRSGLSLAIERKRREEGWAVKLVHKNDAPRQVPEQLRRVIEKLRETFADVEATPIPSRIAHLLEPPPERPPPGAPGERIARESEQVPEEAEAAERQAIPLKQVRKA
jgi:hypothetical protein